MSKNEPRSGEKRYMRGFANGAAERNFLMNNSANGKRTDVNRARI